MKRIHTTSKLPVILLGLSLSLLVGCSQDGNPSSPAAPTAAEPTGSFTLTLVDLAAAEAGLKSAPTAAVYDDLVLMLRGISAHRAAGDALDGWYGSEFAPSGTSFQDLATELGQLIAEAELPIGRYNQVRLLLADGSYVMVDGEQFPLVIPSGLSSGIALHHDFEIVEGRTYDATLDFELGRSVLLTGAGQYVLKPRIRVVERVVIALQVGTIAGVVQPTAAGATVSVEVDGKIVSAVADPISGRFELPGLPVGVYTVDLVPAEGTRYPSISVPSVPVASGETTDLGTILLMMPV